MDRRERAEALTSRRRPGAAATAGVLQVCERHQSEDRRKCEGLVYESSGEEARTIERNNATCKGCGLPLARILDRVAGTETGACDFCFGLRRRVAIASAAFMAIPLKICVECASDAWTVLSAEEDAPGGPDDGE